MFGAILVVVLVVVVVGLGVAILMGKNNALVATGDQQVAVGGRGAERLRDEVAEAASVHGWRVLRGAQAQRAFPPDLVMSQAPAQECELVVEGSRPRRFTAETWRVDQRTRGAVVGAEMRQHLLTVPLATAVPRFAVGRDGVNQDSSAWSVPDDLVSAPSRSLEGLSVLGDDGGVADWLVPSFAQVWEARVWVVVAGDRLVLSRFGEVGAEELGRRLALAGELADAIDRATAAARDAGDAGA